MKKYLPFILPALAVAIVVFFAVRWYQQKTAASLPAPEISAGAEIEELSVAELESLEKMSRGVGNYESLDLSVTDNQSQAQGEVRFEKKENKVYFTISANLPDIKTGYRLWLKPNDSPEFYSSKVLTYGKGGWIVVTAVSQDKLPLSLEVRDGNSVVLRGELK